MHENRPSEVILQKSGNGVNQGRCVTILVNLGETK